MCILIIIHTKLVDLSFSHLFQAHFKINFSHSQWWTKLPFAAVARTLFDANNFHETKKRKKKRNELKKKRRKNITTYFAYFSHLKETMKMNNWSWWTKQKVYSVFLPLIFLVDEFAVCVCVCISVCMAAQILKSCKVVH